MRYFATVRGETRTPSLSNSSFAILASPHAGFSADIRRMRSRRFFGRGGRPVRRDRHFQNERNAERCHLRKVSGFTMISASRQWKHFARASITMRAEADVRGLTLRSVNSVSCFRRNRFSAISAVRGRRSKRRRASKPNSTGHSVCLANRTHLSIDER